MHMTEKSESEVKIKLCDNASILAKLVSILLTLALGIHVVAVATSYWVMAYTGNDTLWHEGIWQSCYKNLYKTWVCAAYEVIHHGSKMPAWFHVTQTFSVFGILVLIPNILISVLYTLLPKLSGRKFAAILTIVLSLCAGSFITIAIIVFGAKYPQITQTAIPNYRQHFHFGFGFEIISAVICYVCSGMLFLELRNNIIL